MLQIIRELLKDPQIQRLMCTAANQNEAAKMLATAAQARGHKATVTGIMKAFSELPAIDPSGLTEEELLKVRGFMISERPGTNHTCCIHCYTEVNTVFVGCGCGGE